MRAGFDDATLALVADVNDLRRGVGQALVALHKAIVAPQGLDLAASVARWAPGAGLLFGGLETRLRRLSPHTRDEAFRGWLRPVLERLADDVPRGERGAPSFLAWLQGRYTDLTRLLRAEAAGTKIHDLVLARDLSLLCGTLSRRDLALSVAALRAAAVSITTG